jgi:tetratricopeptide (TPR) repeat protein
VAPLPDRGAALLAAAMELRAHGHHDAAREALGLGVTWYVEGGERRDEPDAPGLARAYYASGDLERAMATLASAPAGVASDPGYHELRGSVAAVLGDTTAARQALAALEVGGDDIMGGRTFGRALITCLLGRHDEASALLQEAERMGYDVATASHLDPALSVSWKEPQPERSGVGGGPPASASLTSPGRGTPRCSGSRGSSRRSE